MEDLVIKQGSRNKPASSQPAVKFRLGVMMTFLILPIATWWVTVATYIQQNTGENGLGIFSDGFVGRAYSTGAIAAMIAPIICGYFADRWVAAEKIMAALQLAAAIILWRITLATTEAGWWSLMLAYSFCFSPQLGLANAVCFRHLDDPERTFPPIRALLTVSWVMGGWLVGYVAPFWFGESIEDTLWPMRIAVVLHIIALFACLVVPATPPLPREYNREDEPKSGLVPFRMDAISALFGSRLALPVIAMTILSISVQFYSNFTHFFLSENKVVGAAGHMSWGQVTEVVCVLLFPIALHRFGIKWLLVLGCAGYVFRYSLLAIAQDDQLWLYWPAILVHGVCFCFTYLALQIYADRVSPPESRASIQGFIVFLLSGVGAFVGSQSSAWVQIHFLPSGREHDWFGVWMTAAILAAVPTVMLLFMRKARKDN